jgi:heme oxygenase
MQRREEQRRREKEGDAKEKKREAEQMVDQTESTPATSSYANLATDSRGHCSWFLTRTNKEHQATMEHPFMKSIYSKAFDIRAYVAHLSCQFLIFSKLEEYCSFSRAEMPLCAVYDEALHRSLALSADLCFWAGEAYERTLSYSRSLSYDLGEHSFMVPSKATVKYLERLHADRSDPWLLLCHHFLNYNAVLSGGQFLASMVSARGHLWGAEPPQGVAFYAFPPDCVPTHGRVQQYIDTIDGLSIPEQQRSCMLKCMQTIYSLLLEMMDECHAIAPVLAETTDVGGSGLEKVSEVSLPPPPLAAAERQMTFSELLKHDATSGGGTNLGMPLATSVLGRIYDVTGAKDLFGAKGPYEMFTGHDGTYNLAVMSLKQKTLDKFQYEFDDEEKQCLADWIAYFDHRYGPPIAQLTDKSHSISLSDLPRAERIPFQAQPEAGRKDSPPPASRL